MKLFILKIEKLKIKSFYTKQNPATINVCKQRDKLLLFRKPHSTPRFL
jgi:hypothetical protein